MMRHVGDGSVESVESDDRRDFEHTYVLADWRWPATSRHEGYRSCLCIPSSSARQILLNSRNGSSRLAALD
jgi:hypothetical protein